MVDQELVLYEGEIYSSVYSKIDWASKFHGCRGCITIKNIVSNVRYMAKEMMAIKLKLNIRRMQDEIVRHRRKAFQESRVNKRGGGVV